MTCGLQFVFESRNDQSARQRAISRKQLNRNNCLQNGLTLPRERNCRHFFLENQRLRDILLPMLNEPQVKMVNLQDLIGESLHMPAIVASSAERMLGLTRLNKAYRKILRDMQNGSSENFFGLAVKYLNLRYHLSPGELDHIPRTGAAIVVANHPHGLSDGLIFGDLLTKVREDVRIVANEQLTLCEELAPWMIQMDVYGGDEATRKNYAGMKQILAWLKAGHCIGIFPAGTVSSYSIQDKQVTDDPWNTHIAALIRRTKATAVPVYLPGRNSLLFQGISLINREARVAFLPRAVGRDSRRLHHVKIGHPVSGSALSQLPSDEAIAAQLRLRTYLLSKRYEKSRKPSEKKAEKSRHTDRIIPPIPPQELQAEIDALPSDCCLVDSPTNAWKVYVASSNQIPKLLREIGRLREITFRAAGEGTGKGCDLDVYDNHYKHLFLWDSAESKFIGAYRMGLTDKILEQYGKKGLYNAEFFEFSPDVLKVLSQGIEMGRAFIVPEYQKRPTALGLIWMGIGQFMVRHPEYRYLYGTVSISKDYTRLSRSLIVSYLESQEMDTGKATGVRAFMPPHKMRLRGAELRILPVGLTDSQNLSGIVSEIEEDGKGIPVLLRQYLKLNGKILAFSIDPNFGDVLDCLILVDIYRTPERSLRKYMGAEASEVIINNRGNLGIE